MSKFTVRIMRIFLGVILIFLLFHNSFGQIQDKDILDKEISLNLKNMSLAQVCSLLTVFEKIPLGLEETVDFKNNENLQINTGTLKEVLDSIVKQEPDYKWEARDGVVNIYPIRSRDAILKAFLETKIKSFSSKKDGGRQEIAKIIENLDGIKVLLNPKQIQLGIGTRANLYVEDATTNIDISNIDLRGILNKVVKDSGDSKLWTISRTKDGGIFLVF
jgi:hypothetical protein